MTVTVLESIKKLLSENSIQYEIIEHAPVHTSAQAAAVRDTDPSMGAKALVFYGDKVPLLMVLPGNEKVDFKAFKLVFGIKDLRMATSEQVLELTSLKIGSIPPLGSVLGLKSYYDESIKSKDKVAFNAGELTVSIIMTAQDLIRIENPVFGKFV